jgi:hypothetical protein
MRLRLRPIIAVERGGEVEQRLPMSRRYLTINFYYFVVGLATKE